MTNGPTSKQPASISDIATLIFNSMKTLNPKLEISSEGIKIIAQEGKPLIYNIQEDYVKGPNPDNVGTGIQADTVIQHIADQLFSIGLKYDPEKGIYIIQQPQQQSTGCLFLCQIQ